ncbi:MAG: UDP-N-acetylglucosamine 2-epimerase (non-hydrolyzing) [Flavobacteriales bacterium]|nr:UDP-N-acetylglucosamine 2-epimerase (non-hydrolyzing) [Flavobacteriales bacterium]
MKKKILIVFGTRPEAIKMAPVVKAFKLNQNFITKVCVTAQHRQMLDQVLEFFEIQPDFDLNLMKPNQTLYNLTSEIIKKMQLVLEEYTPDFVFVHGDTTTTMATSIAAFYSGAKVCHVEAGLRTNNKKSPFPEEINRQVTARITDFHFAPTEKSKNNLILENIKEDNIIVTGNTVIDALLDGVKKVNNIELDDIDMLKSLINKSKDLVVVTGHRRENHGEGFLNICRALKEIAKNDNVQIIYPVHLNPNVQKPVNEILSNIDNINLIKPLPYEAFLWLMEKAKIIITDSGGVQEEAPSLGKPVLVMRNTTERPEAVDAGTVILVGTNVKKIVDETNILLNNTERYQAMSKLHNPYGDGYASQRIVQFLLNQIK